MAATYEQKQMQLVACPIDEKHALETDELVNSTPTGHAGAGRCRFKGGKRRNALVRGGMFGMIVTLITLLAFVAMSLLCPEMNHLFKRQNSSGTTSTQNSFTQHKYWIIIICVVGILNLERQLNSRRCSRAYPGYLSFGVLLSGILQKSDLLPLLHPRVLRLPWYITSKKPLIPGCLECIGCGLCCEGISEAI
jgi:uncharacterized protein YbaR (Trm112 family)